MVFYIKSSAFFDEAYNIETNWQCDVFHSGICVGGSNYTTYLPFVDSIFWSYEIIIGAGFYFNYYKLFAVCGDDIKLMMMKTPVCFKNFISVFFKILLCNRFALPACFVSLCHDQSNIQALIVSIACCFSSSGRLLIRARCEPLGSTKYRALGE